MPGTKSGEVPHARQSRMTGHHADAAVTPDALVPQSHPIRRIKPMVDRALAQLSPTLDRMYADHGRTSIPPEHLLKACLLMALFPISRSRAQRAAILRASGVRPAVQVVPGPEHHGPQFRPLGVLQEQGAAIGCRRGPGVSAGDSRAGSGAAVAVGGTFQRGWNAAGSVGIGEEF